MKYQGIGLLVLLCVNAARSTQDENSGKTTIKRGTAGVGDFNSYSNHGHSFSGRPSSPYTDFTTPTPYGSPLHPAVKVTIARPYSVPPPFSGNIPHPYPSNVPKPYPTYPTFGAALANIHEQWSQYKGYGAPANAHSSSFGGSALQGYGLGSSGHDLLGSPYSPFAAAHNAYGPSPNGLGSSAGKLSLLAAGLAANPEISLAAAAAQHKHASPPSAYSGLPGGPTKTGLLAARLAANPEIGFAAAAANKHHGPPSSVTGHADYAVAAALGNQHAHAHTGSDLIAQLAGTSPSYATAAAAAHLGYGAHPSAQLGYGAHPSAQLGYAAHPSAHLGYGAHPSAHLGYGAHPSAHLGYSAHPSAQLGYGAHPSAHIADYSAALQKIAALKAHGAYPDYQ